MFSKLEISVAYRYLKAKKTNRFISVTAILSFLGIALGVAVLIIVMSVMSGFRVELVDRILGINSHLTLYSHSNHIKNYQERINQIKNNKDIKLTMPTINEQAMLMSKTQGTGVMVKGIRIKDFKKRDILSTSIVKGDVNNLKQPYTIILGKNLALNLDLKIGDLVTLLSPEIQNTIFGIVPRMRDYEIVGVFDVGMSEYNANLAFINLESAQKHFRYYDSVNTIEILLHDLSKIDNVQNYLHKQIANQNLSEYIKNWMQSNGALINALKVEQTVMFFILTLIIIIAVFNIISSLIMLVDNKSKNIALMRTMGMTRLNIIKVFILMGTIIGTVGSIIGAFMGVLFASNIENIRQFLESVLGVNLFNPLVYFLSQLPSDINIYTILYITFLSIFLSIIATIYPAWKAANLKPVELLRYE